MGKRGYQPIEDYGIIGDLHTIALVGVDGSIDFLSFPHFDSPTVFAALLDAGRGVRFQIRPGLHDGSQKQMYLPDTNVLITRTLASDGVAEVSDYMPVGIDEAKHFHTLVRRAKCVRGRVAFDLICEPHFDYARADHTVEQHDSDVVFNSRGSDKLALRLRASVPVRIEDGAVVARFTLSAGETAAFVLEQANPEGAERESPSAAPNFVAESFKATVNFWRAWLGHSQYTGRWREIVHRSALLLKLLVSDTHGSLVAAATFGLPEELAGERNWDYRYTWIRDASFTLYALIRLGYTAEAGAFMRWIEDRCNDLEPDGSPISHDLWQNLVRLVDWVTEHWQLPDEGVWEVRGGRREFLYSRLMCWVAVDRAIRLADRRSFPYPFDRWRVCRDEINRDIRQNLWDAR